MDPLVAVARGVLAGVLAVSALAKATDRRATRAGLRGLGLPPGLDLTLVVVEGFTALGLLMERRSPAAAWVALGLLVLFTVFVIMRLAQGNRRPCPCFGATTTAPLGARTVARNLVLIAVAVVATAGSEVPGVLIWVSAGVTAAAVWWAARRGAASRPASGG